MNEEGKPFPIFPRKMVYFLKKIRISPGLPAQMEAWAVTLYLLTQRR